MTFEIQIRGQSGSNCFVREQTLQVLWSIKRIKKQQQQQKKTGESALKLDNFPLCIVKLLNTKGNKPYSFKLFADIGRF